MKHYSTYKSEAIIARINSLISESVRILNQEKVKALCLVMRSDVENSKVKRGTVRSCKVAWCKVKFI